MFVVHYHKLTGKISAWGNGDSEQSHFPDHEIVRFDEEFLIDPKTEKFDLSTFRLVPRTLADRNDEILIDLKARIQIELENTAAYMLVDAELTPQQLEDWKTYRRTLRSLFKAPPNSAAEMLASWPIDPNGVDAVAHLRNRK
jgi:hypothetical protein